MTLLSLKLSSCGSMMWTSYAVVMVGSSLRSVMWRLDHVDPNVGYFGYVVWPWFHARYEKCRE